MFLTEMSICENKLPYKILRKQNSMHNSELTDLYKKKIAKKIFSVSISRFGSLL